MSEGEAPVAIQEPGGQPLEPEAPAEQGSGREDMLAAPPPLRTALVAAWLRRQAARVLEIPASRVQADRSLLTLGLDSLAAIELASAIESGLGVPVPLPGLLAGPSLAELAAQIAQRLGQLESPLGQPALQPGQPAPALVEPAPPSAAGMAAAAGDAPAAAAPHPPHSPRHPLSWGQRALWLLDRLAPGSPAYIIAGAARLRGPLDVPLLHRVLRQLVGRHPVLRATFELDGESCVQVIHEQAAFGFAVEDATGWTEARLAERLVEEAHRPFDLARGPLLRVTLFARREPGERRPAQHLVVLAVHHIVADFASLGVLLGELGALYREETLPPLVGSYAGYVQRQAERLAGAEGARLASYWLTALAPGAPPIDLLTDRPRPALATFRGGARALWLDRELTAGLTARGDAAGATAFMTLLAVFLVLLHRHSGQDQLLVGTPTSGRSSPELAGLVGYFVNPVVLRGDLAGDPTFDELLGRVRETAIAAFAHQDYPFPLLVERLGAERDPGRSPLFQVLFGLYRERRRSERGLGGFALGRGGATLDLGGLRLESVPLPRRSAQFELSLLMAESGGALAGALQFNSDLFDAATAERMLAQLATLAAALAAPRDHLAGGPRRGIGELPLLAAAERHQLLVEWSVQQEVPRLATGGAAAGTGPLLPVHSGLGRGFVAAAAGAPEAVAVVCEGACLTYGELDRRANQLARHLRRRGVAPEARVALCLERSLDLVIGMLGISKAGGAYVPLDPSYPRDRLRFIAEDALAGVSRPVLVTEQRLAGLFSPEPAGDGHRQPFELVLLDAERETIARESGHGLPDGAWPEGLAYVIYTSGSTGRPKGVMVTHANVVRLFAATRGWFDFGPGDVWTLFHSAAFDFSVWELWGALLHGGRLVVVPYWVSRSPASFHRLLATEGVTVLNQTPSAFRLLDEADRQAAAGDPAGAGSGLALRVVVFGGEAVELPTLAPWVERHGDERPRLVNMYGITETTVHVTCRPLAAADLGERHRSPIGRGISDLRLYLLDAGSRPVPLGVPGEIHVGGAGVARGYLGRPELTAARFVPDPYGEAPGGRLYRAGDLARFRPDGGLDFLGRVDHQVKIRGFRVELGEIEAALAAQPAVLAAAVALRSTAGEALPAGPGAPADRRLVAYVVARGGLGGGGAVAGGPDGGERAGRPGDPGASPPAGETMLPAGETPLGAGEASRLAGELRQALAARVPDYMVPAAFVFLPRLPRTPSGKLDRRALPAPGAPGTRLALAGGAAQAPGAPPGRVAPRTATEELLAGVWAEVLGVEVVGPGDDFFHLGGHSLLAVRVAARLRDLLGVELPVARLFELSRLAELARELEAATGDGRPRLEPIRRRLGGTPESVPSFAQERLWFLDRLEPGSATYNLPGALHLLGPLAVAALAGSLAAIRRRHQVLRTVFVAHGGAVMAAEPGMAPAPGAAGPRGTRPETRSAAAAPLPLVDLSGLPARCRAPVAEMLRREEARRPFDLAAGPLLRATLLRLSGGGASGEAPGGEHLLLLTLHHIAGDAWSLEILARELAALYAAGVSGRPPAPGALPPLPIQYADFARWQRDWLSGALLAAEIDWWRERLAGPRGEPPVLDLPLDRPRPAVLSRRGARHPLALPGALTAEVAALARRRGVTQFMVLLAAFDTLLFRYCGQADVAVGTPVANRDRPETQDLVGLFVNTLVLRLDLAGDPTFGELLARTRELALAAYAHQDVPFDKLVGELVPHRSLAEAPFFQVLLALQPAPPCPALPGLAVTFLEGDSGTAKFDLSLALGHAADGGLAGHWTFSRDLFDPPTIARLSGQLGNLLAGIVAAEGCDRRLGELPLLDPSERHQLRVEWNDQQGVPRPAAGGAAATTAWEEGGDDLVHVPFERRAALHPAAVALVLGDAAVTYGELAARASRLARTLRTLGLGPDGVAGICAEPSFELVIGLLAILQAGGAYLPLDPQHPPERLAQVLADSGARLVLAGAALAGRLPDTARLLLLDDPPGDRAAADQPPADPAPPSLAAPACAVPSLAAPSRGAPPPTVHPDNAAYVLYTSGSTGAPKGVVVPHRAVANRLRFQVAEDLAPDARVLQRTRLGFDVSVVEIFAPLWLGAAVVLTEPARQQDVAYLARLIVELQITNATLPPATFPALLADEELCRCRSLRRVVTGGDKVPGDLPARYHAAMGAPAPLLISRYGPTEATISVAEWRCGDEREAPAPLPPLVPLGRPIAGAHLYLLDPALREVPPGAAGELCIAGICLARGYLARPDLTAAAFVPDPLAGRADRGGDLGARLYRTGDLARHRAGGVLEFLGRIDRQVKIRGFRLELGEVEAACARHPDVEEVAVVAGEEAAGDGKRLVAYLVVRPGSELTEPAGPAAQASRLLRAFVAEQLPAFMVPAAFVVLPRLPLTANGKVDRGALARLPPPSATPGQAAPDPPRTAVEELVAGLWQEILGGVEPRRDDDFFDLGGHSLLATQLVSRLGETLQVDLPLAKVFEFPTLAGLAAAVEAASGLGGPPRPPTIRPVPRDRPLPLSFAQERLWFLDRLVPGRAVYNMPVALAARGDLRPAWIDAVLSEVVRRHEALRTRFDDASGQAAQLIDPPAPVRLPLVDLAGLPAERRQAEALRLARDEAQRPFDLTRGPLLRGAILAAGGPSSRDHVLLLDLHHIVSDGWSVGVMIREIRELYRAVLAGAPSPLPALPIQYGDYAVWQRQWLDEERLTGLLAHWRERLAGAPAALDLPADRPRPKAQSHRGGMAGLTLGPRAVESLAAAGRQHGATLFMTLLAGFAGLLARLGGQEDLVVGSPIANRHHLATERLIGFFVNSLALRFDLAGDPPGAVLLARTRETALAAYAHQDLPFERLVEDVRPERRLSQNPLFQVMCVLQNAPKSAEELPGLTLSRLDTGAPDAKFDLALFFNETGAGPSKALAADLSYAADLFDPPTAARLLGHLANLLAGLAADPAAPLSTLPLLSAAERHQLAVEWNDQPAAPGVDVVVCFEQAAAAAPGSPALLFLGEQAEEQLSYGELNAWADRVARSLRAVGVGPETLVALAGYRGISVVAGLLGIWKAGGVFVPLDPALPPARLSFLLEDSRASVVLAEESVLEALPPHRARVVNLMRVDDDATVSGMAGPAAERGNLAYFIYTSGTTGWPKASGVERGNLADVIAAQQRRLNLGPGDRLLCTAPFSFDFFTLELMTTLTTGAAAVLFPLRPVPDFERLATALPRITAMEMVPAVGRQLLTTLQRRGGGLVPSLRTILVGGDRVPVELLEDLHRTFPRAQVWIIYGPTETTMICTAWPVPRSGGAIRSLLGRPLAGCRIELHDRHANLTPIGVPGEIWIGGVGISRGYVRRPELTAEKYVISGTAREASRCYRSGDLARQLPDGTIEFLGRIDAQVKLRGFRVETAEVEAVLARHPAVREAVVVARAEGGRPDGGGPEVAQQLIAYVVRREGDLAPAAAPAADHIAAWNELYEDTYQAGEVADPTLNLSGWNSSYTGLPIPEDEMREWVATTVERLLALAPRRVLEVGCGTGLLLFRLAPHCESYRGTDFSRAALDFLARQLVQPERALPQVALSQALADDWRGVTPGELDLVILNSIVQYFPSGEYLLRVLEQAVAALAPGGRVFLGDLRSLPLAEALYTSVELATAPETLPVGELKRRIRRRQLDEEELLVAPDLFIQLPRHLPAISRVEVWKKRGRAVNELTRFRYDVVLTVGPAAAGPTAPSQGRLPGGPGGAQVPGNAVSTSHRGPAKEGTIVLDWQASGFSLPLLAARLASAPPDAMVLVGIPDRRLAEETTALALLADPGPETATVGQLRQAVAERVAREPGVDPEEVWLLGARHGYAVELVTAGPAAAGGLRFTAELRRPGVEPVLPDAVPPPDAALSVRALASNPLRGKLARELVPELRRLVKAALPDYMVPAAFVVLDSFPLSAHGKIDRTALPAPDTVRPALSEAYVAPRTPLEESLAQVWADLLGLDQVGIDDNFFELGGHSLLATQVISRLRDTFAVELPVRALFEEPTVAGLAGRLEAARRVGGAAGSGPPPLVPRPRVAAVPGAALDRLPAGSGASALPLSFAQQRLWFLDRLTPGSSAYNVPLALQLTGELDVAALAASVAVIVRRHETLRTTFHEVAGEAVQVIAASPPAWPALPLVDLRALGDGAAGEARGLAAVEARRPFDLARGPLFRPVLVRLAAREHLWLGTMHHIVSDGWSLGVALRELRAAYSALIERRAPRLPALPVQYADYAAWQRQWLTGEALAAEIGHWRERLSGLPPRIELPTDRPHPPLETMAGDSRPFRLPAAACTPWRERAVAAGVTPFMWLLAAFQALLGRISGQEDLAVGSPIAGRNRVEIEGLIGFFVNTLVLRGDLAGDPNLGEIVARTREATLAAYAHQDVPFERLVEELAPVRDVAHQPLFQVMFALQTAPAGELALPGLALTVLPVATRSAKFELTLSLAEVAGGLAGVLEYQTDLFDAATAERLLGHFTVLLAATAADPGLPLSLLPLLTAVERHQLLVEWNDQPGEPSGECRTATEVVRRPRPATGGAAADQPGVPRLATGGAAADTGEGRAADLALHQLFELQAQRTPEAVAVISADDGQASEDGGTGKLGGVGGGPAWQGGPSGAFTGLRWLSYRELDERANRLARRLVALGVGPEMRVGIAMERSAAMVVGLLAILKAGGAYVPLDPSYPRERLAFILADAQQGIARPLLLTEETLRERLPEVRGRVLCLDDPGEPSTWAPPDEPGGRVPPESLAYVIYTSGSTGRPKGVAITHRSAVALLHWAAELFSPAELAGVLASTSITFDLSVFELFLPLARGGTVILVDNALALPGLPAGAGVTLVNTVPSAMAELLRLAGIPATVRTVNLAGEPLKRALADRIHAELPGVRRLYNLYGPSEDTTYSTFVRVAAGNGREPTIGWPIAGTRAHVLDRRGEPLPAGVPGELCLGGAGLARGYLARPELTARSFVPDPFGGPGERLYRTGDLVRRLPGGELDFLGRIDHQIKLRGFRIEPGEIEAALLAHPGVREAAAMVREDTSGLHRLMAYVAIGEGDACKHGVSHDAGAIAGGHGDRGPSVAVLLAHLRQRLPEYMVPERCVLLPALPLTANGKVDRRALTADDAADAAAASERRGRAPAAGLLAAPRDAVEAALAAIWSELLGRNDFGVEDGFFALGGHSLLAVRLVARIRERFGCELPLATLFRAPTIARLAALLSAGCGPAPARSALVELTPAVDGRGPREVRPFFCVHPVGGNVLCYAELARALGPEQPFYGLQLPDPVVLGPEPTIEAMAAHYVAALATVSPAGPYSLGGWSVGGVIAWEMARQLAAAGREVDLLALIDPSPPRRGPVAAGSAETRLPAEFAEDLAALGLDGPGMLAPELGTDQSERLFALFRTIRSAFDRYRPAPHPGRLSLLVATRRPDVPPRRERQEPAAAWAALARGRVELETLPGDHYSLLRPPAVTALARALGRRLDARPAQGR